MNDPSSSMTGPASEIGHVHADISGGWLRAGVFGAMDGLVTNLALVAGVGAASESAEVVVVTGIAGLVAGAFSMALGEYTSVATQNEQVDREVAVERAEILDNPDAEREELAELFIELGMRQSTATLAAEDVHRDLDQAVLVHVTHELGLDPEEKPSPIVAAVSSFLMFSVGALIPLLPYLLGFASLSAGLLTGAVGLLVAGAAASAFTVTSWWASALRQLLFGAVAVAATYTVGSFIGVSLS